MRTSQPGCARLSHQVRTWFPRENSSGALLTLASEVNSLPAREEGTSWVKKSVALSQGGRFCKSGVVFKGTEDHTQKSPKAEDSHCAD